MNLLQAAARFGAAARDTEIAEEEAVRIACQMVAERARSLIGVPHGWWPPLAPETLSRKDNVNTPLLETGELRASIEWNAEGKVGHVGSDSDKAVWQELGTSRGIPPRSFLMAAAMQEGHKIEKVAAALIGAAIAGRLENGRAVREFFHILHEAGHALHEVKEAGQELFDENNEQDKERPR